MQGASAVQQLLTEQLAAPIRVFAVWEPVIATDWAAPSTAALGRLRDPRVTQYWDKDRLLSHAMGEHDDASIVWDYIAVYEPQQTWTTAPPKPFFAEGPVVRVISGARRAVAELRR